jgi:hypothetical protein
MKFLGHFSEIADLLKDDVYTKFFKYQPWAGIFKTSYDNLMMILKIGLP